MERSEFVIRRYRGVSRGFTLVEILVVIAVIVLLVSVLLPALATANENARRVACGSNLRQVGTGITTYTNDQATWLPYPPRLLAHPADAFWWQPGRISEIGSQGLGPYLRLDPTRLRILRCPSDTQAVVREAAGKYPLTFTFNDNINGTGPSPVEKLGQIRDGSSLIVMYEENGASITDGMGQLWNVRGAWGGIGMVGLRHDRVNRTQFPDLSSAVTGMPNRRGQGNVLFVDGHVEYAARTYAHSKYRALPNPDMFPNEPEIGP